MPLLRSVTLLCLAMLVMTAIAIVIGTQQPPQPLFAFAHTLAAGRYQLVLYDAESRYQIPLRVFDRIEMLHWLDDGSGLAVSNGDWQHFAVYTLNEGWATQTSGVVFADRERRYTPEGRQIVIRQNENNLQDWDVFFIEPSNRSEQPIPILQDLPGSPLLRWSPTEQHLVLFAYGPTVISFEYIDWQTQAREPIATFPAVFEVSDIYFSPNEQWVAVVIQTTQTNFALYMLDLGTRDLWQVADTIPPYSVAGFLPR